MSNNKSISLSKQLSPRSVKFSKLNLDSEIIKLQYKKKQLLKVIKDRQARQLKKINTQKQIESKQQKLNNLLKDLNNIQIEINKNLQQLQKIEKKMNQNKIKRIQFIKQVSQDCEQLQKCYLNANSQEDLDIKQHNKQTIIKQKLYIRLIQRQLQINEYLKQLIFKESKQLSSSLTNKSNKHNQLRLSKLLIRYCINYGAILTTTDKYLGQSYQKIRWRDRRQIRISQWQQNWGDNHYMQESLQQQYQTDQWQGNNISLDVLKQLQLNRDIYVDVNDSYQQLFPQQQQSHNHQHQHQHLKKDYKLIRNQQYRNNPIIQSHFIELYSFIIDNNLVDDFKSYLFEQIQNSTTQRLDIDQNDIRTNLIIEIEGLFRDLMMILSQQQTKDINISVGFNNNPYPHTIIKYTKILTKLIEKKRAYKISIFSQQGVLNKQYIGLRILIKQLQQQQQEINIKKIELIQGIQSLQRQLLLDDKLCNQQQEVRQNKSLLLNEIEQIDSAIIYLKSRRNMCCQSICKVQSMQSTKHDKSTNTLLKRMKSSSKRMVEDKQNTVNLNNNQNITKNITNNISKNNSKNNKLRDRIKTPSIPNSPKIFLSQSTTIDCKSPQIMKLSSYSNKYIHNNHSNSNLNLKSTNSNSNNKFVMTKSSSSSSQIRLKTYKQNQNNHINNFIKNKMTVVNNKNDTKKLRIL